MNWKVISSAFPFAATLLVACGMSVYVLAEEPTASGDDVVLVDIVPGDIVLLRETTELKRSGKVVGQAAAGETLEVREVRGAWADVGKQTPGWVRCERLLKGDAARQYLREHASSNTNNLKLLLSLAQLDVREKNWDSAKRDLDQILSQDAKNHEAHYWRGLVAMQQEEFGTALFQFTKAIELQPEEPKYYRERAKIFRAQRKYQEVANDIEQLARLKVVTAEELNEIAWRYCTHPEATLRNAKKAIAFARQACELTDFEDYRIIDTLAAAYAESGDFASAESYQQQAIDLITDYFQRADCEARLKMYRLKQPFREQPR